MTAAVVPWAIAAFAVAMALAVWRLVVGPTVADRILALDTLYVDAIAVIVLAGLRDPASAYFEAALVIALLGFVGTVALSRFAALDAGPEESP